MGQTAVLWYLEVTQQRSAEPRGTSGPRGKSCSQVFSCNLAWSPQTSHASVSPKNILANVTTPKNIILYRCASLLMEVIHKMIKLLAQSTQNQDLGIRITNSMTVAKAPAPAADPWVRSPAHVSREKQSFAMEFAVWANQNGERRQKLVVV